MTKEQVPIPVAIFFAGFVAGILAGAGLKLGLPTDEIEVGFTVLENLCYLDKNTSKMNCSAIPIIGTLVSILLGILVAWIESNRINSWKIGAGIYGGWWIIGLVYIFNSVS